MHQFQPVVERCWPLTGDEVTKRHEILNRLFQGKMDMSKPTFIEPPFTADYVWLLPNLQLSCRVHLAQSITASSAAQGYNITIGPGCYMNFNCCLLDCAPITIGKNVGPFACHMPHPPTQPPQDWVMGGMERSCTALCCHAGVVWSQCTALPAWPPHRS